jgi:RimK family alpha-L-glutamate ligase
VAKVGYPIVCKLTRTGKGAGVYKYDSEADFARYIEKLKGWDSEARNFLLQKFVDYEYDLRVLIIGSDMFCMRRIPGKGEFRANFSLGGSVELYKLDDKGKDLARKALDAVDVKVGGVDLLIAKDGKRYILEVNHTPGMLGMEKATGKNITRKYIEFAIKNAN